MNEGILLGVVYTIFAVCMVLVVRTHIRLARSRKRLLAALQEEAKAQRDLAEARRAV